METHMEGATLAPLPPTLAERVANLPRVPGVACDDEVAEWIADNWGLNVLGKTGVLHPHPRLAVARKRLERLGVKRAMQEALAAGGGVLSVAPNVPRETSNLPADFRHHYHAMLPNVQPNDSGRIASAAQVSVSTCGHLWGQCDCMSRSGNVVFSTHSAYYASPDAYDEQLVKARAICAYAVINTFAGAGGVRYRGESTWCLEPTPDGVLVSEHVRGNHYAYRHPHPGWLMSPVVQLLKGSYLVNEVVFQLGETVLVRTVRSAAPPLGDWGINDDWSTITTRNATEGGMWRAGTLSGASGTRPTDTALQVLQVDEYVMLPGAVSLRLRTAPRPVIISPSILGEVAARMVNTPRDAAALQDATWHARRAYERADFPPSLMAEAITFTAQLALTHNAAVEANAAATVARTYGSLFRFHHAATTYNLGRVIGLMPIVAALSVVCVIVGLVWAYVPDYHHLVAGIVSASALVFCCAFGVRTALLNLHLWGAGATWARSVRGRRGAAVMVPTAIPPLMQAEPVDEEAPERPMRTDAVIDLAGAEEAPARQRTANPVVVADGLVTATHVPLPILPSLQAEVQGVRNRVCLDVPLITEEALDLSIQTFMSDPAFAPAWGPPIEWGSREAEVARWIKTQPLGMQPRLQKAWRQSGKKLAPAAFAKDAFIKVEKTHKQGDPRIIQALSDQLKVFLSPYIGRVGSVLRKAFDGLSGVMFASGRSADEIAGRLETWWDEERVSSALGVPWIVEADHSRFDAHAADGLKDVFGLVLVHHAVPEDVVDAYSKSQPVGVTKSGVRYDAGFGLCSGSPETSCAGTLWNGVSYRAAAGEAQLSVAKGIFLGDDNCGVIRDPLSRSREQLVADLTEAYVRFGLTTDIVLHDSLNTVEFASRRFWPLASGRRRLGAKPGRAISRLGLRIYPSQSANLAADLISLWQDNAHVPFLRVVLKHYRRLTAGTKAKWGHRREWDAEIHAADHGVAHPVDTWVMTRQLYGLGPDDEASLDAYLAGVQVIPSVISHRVIDRLLEVDVGVEV